MKVHIVFTFTEQVWGGANQFLRALRTVFERHTMYSNNIDSADVLLFNSYHCLLQMLVLKRKMPQKYIVHRLGPMFYLHRGSHWRFIDRIILSVNQRAADATIFQSKWSFDQAVLCGFDRHQPHYVINNACDSSIFFPSPIKHISKDKKIRLIAVSWSANIKKGYELYRFLEDRLDWTKYEMTFIGNVSGSFRHIRCLPPMSQVELADQLRAHDLFISPVEDDACSNAILEAMACGLPVVAKDSGGNKEIVGNGGLVYSDNEDCVRSIEKIVVSYSVFQKSLYPPLLNNVATKYEEVCTLTMSFCAKPAPVWWSILSVSLQLHAFSFYDTYRRLLTRL